MKFIVEVNEDFPSELIQYLVLEASHNVAGVLRELKRDPAMGNEDEGRIFCYGKEVGTWKVEA